MCLRSYTPQRINSDERIPRQFLPVGSPSRGDERELHSRSDAVSAQTRGRLDRYPLFRVRPAEHANDEVPQRQQAPERSRGRELEGIIEVTPLHIRIHLEIGVVIREIRGETRWELDTPVEDASGVGNGDV